MCTWYLEHPELGERFYLASYDWETKTLTVLIYVIYVSERHWSSPTASTFHKLQFDGQIIEMLTLLSRRSSHGAFNCRGDDMLTCRCPA